MKILLSFLQDTGQQPHDIPAYRFWQHYIKNGIEEAGMAWLEVPGADWAEGLVHPQGSAELASWSNQTWDKTLLYIKGNRKKIGVFLCYLYPKQINETAIAEIKQLGIPCINFYCDNVRQFTKVPREFKVFDWVWVPEYETLDMYRRAGINHIHLPMPMWVDKKYREVVTVEHTNLVTFIGSKDILRQNLLGEAIGKELDITVRGAGWLPELSTQAVAQSTLSEKIANQFSFIEQHGLKDYAIKNLQQFNRPAAYSVDATHIQAKPGHQEYIQITQSSAITLGINRVPTFKRFDTNPLTYSRLRDIEAPMLGACYLTEHCAGLDILYEPGKEICTYKTADELVYQAKRLLADKPRRDALRAAGQRRALAEHSIPASLLKLKAAIFK